MKLNKRGFEVSFAWLFAIIVGSVILFLAIYGTTKTIDSGNLESSAKTSKQLGILLNPLETSFESGLSVPISTSVETRIYNTCSDYAGFGKQGIQISEKSFNKWPDPLLENTFTNKYIFSENPTEGKNFYVFSKPFEFPFKIADLIYITSEKEKFCFVNAPEHIEEEITDLNQVNLFVENCPEDSIQVCFGGSNCDIQVSYLDNYVQRYNSRVYFETDALMYGAIFADSSNYECQVQRLIAHLESLIVLYKEKDVIISSQQCDSNLQGDLVNLYNVIQNIEDSSQLLELENLIKTIENKNAYSSCKLW